MNYEVEIIRSKRKTVSVEVTPDLRILARVPHRMPENEIRLIVQSKSDWLAKAIKRQKAARDAVLELPEKLADADIEVLKNRTRAIVTERAAHYAPLVGVRYNRIAIRAQKTRWGSCSSKGNLNFNCLLALCPIEIIDYVVVHELCHLIELNHSPRFWNEVARILPDYKVRRKWLKTNSSALISRIK